MRSSLFRRSTLGSLAAAVLILVPPTPPVQPEPAAGTIRGRVTDPAGAPIANAQVFLVRTAFNTLSDRAGAYEIRNVPAGIVSVRAAFIGFSTHQVDSVRVRDGRVTVVDITLQPTSVQAEEITVSVQGAPLTPRDMVKTRRERVGIGQGLEADMSDAGVAKRSLDDYGQVFNTEEYARIYDNRFLAAASNPLSTFSIDVDAASYSNIRRFLTYGHLPPKDAVRIEEMINYFSYDYPEPTDRHPFSITTELADAPWSPGHKLVRIGLQGRRPPTADLPPSNLVFLIDVSGSMATPDKLPLVKQAFRMLVNQLREKDRVAIVVYAGAAGLVLPSTPGSDKRAILEAIDRLEAGGSTAGGAGIRLAYEIARQYHMPNGNNRVILATDGDFNVGVSSTSELIRLIEEKREQGTFLTVLGFGTGNLKDGRMEQLADKGNGNYAYIDNIREANKVFVREFGGTLFTIAKDVKIQVEFNPARVASYRLIGYENRVLAKEDFDDDTKDAGELGAGHSVTALYEIAPVGAGVAARGDSLRYQQVTLRPDADRSDEWMTVSLRYKEPDGKKSRLLTHVVKGEVRSAPSDDFRFASAVAAFGMILRGSEHRGTATLDDVLTLARGALGRDPDGDRAEFVRLVESARAINVATRLE